MNGQFTATVEQINNGKPIQKAISVQLRPKVMEHTQNCHKNKSFYWYYNFFLYLFYVPILPISNLQLHAPKSTGT